MSVHVKELYKEVLEKPEVDLNLLQKLLSEAASICPHDEDFVLMMQACTAHVQQRGNQQLAGRVTALLKKTIVKKSEDLPVFKECLEAISCKFAHFFVLEVCIEHMEKLTDIMTSTLKILANEEYELLVQQMCWGLDLVKTLGETKSLPTSEDLSKGIQVHVQKGVTLQRVLMQAKSKAMPANAPLAFDAQMEAFKKKALKTSTSLNKTLVDHCVQDLQQQQQQLQLLANGLPNQKNWMEGFAGETFDDLLNHAKETLLTLDGGKLKMCIEGTEKVRNAKYN
eukprot:3804149-Amphidinium_carterae.7